MKDMYSLYKTTNMGGYMVVQVTESKNLSDIQERVLGGLSVIHVLKEHLETLADKGENVTADKIYEVVESLKVASSHIFAAFDVSHECYNVEKALLQEATSGE